MAAVAAAAVAAVVASKHSAAQVQVWHGAKLERSNLERYLMQMCSEMTSAVNVMMMNVL